MSANEVEEKPATLISEEEAKMENLRPQNPSGGDRKEGERDEMGIRKNNAEDPNGGAFPSHSGGEYTPPPLNPAHAYFKNQYLMDKVIDLCDLEASQRIYIIRKFHSGFVEIADRVMDKLHMHAVRSGVVRATAALDKGSSRGQVDHNDKGNAPHQYPHLMHEGPKGMSADHSGMSNDYYNSRGSEIVSRASRVGWLDQDVDEQDLRHDSSIDNLMPVKKASSSPKQSSAIPKNSPSSLSLRAASFPVFSNKIDARATTAAAQHHRHIYADPHANVQDTRRHNDQHRNDGSFTLSPSFSSDIFLPPSPRGGHHHRQEEHHHRQQQPRGDSYSPYRSVAGGGGGGGVVSSYDGDQGVVELAVDVSDTIHKKDVRVRAMARAFEEERRIAEAFKQAEKRRTEAFRRRQQILASEQLSGKRTTVGNGTKNNKSLVAAAAQPLNTHASFIELQKTREKVEAREQIKAREEAIEARKKLEDLNRKAQQEARRRIGILTSDAIEQSKQSYLDASATVRNLAQKNLFKETEQRRDKSQQIRALVHRQHAREHQFETLLATANAKESERLERAQHFSHGIASRDAEVGGIEDDMSTSRNSSFFGSPPSQRARSQRANNSNSTLAIASPRVGIVKNVPVEAAATHAVFSPRKGVQAAVALPPPNSASPSLFSTTNASSSRGGGPLRKGVEPINPLTYHRLCGGGEREREGMRGSSGGSLAPAAIFEEAFGNGRKMTNIMDSFYLLRGPQDVSWKR